MSKMASVSAQDALVLRRHRGYIPTCLKLRVCGAAAGQHSHPAQTNRGGGQRAGSCQERGECQAMQLCCKLVHIYTQRRLSGKSRLGAILLPTAACCDLWFKLAQLLSMLNVYQVQFCGRL